MDLDKEDYLNILKFYNIKLDYHFNLSYLKKLVEKIIAKKLCSCIKKVDNTKYEDEERPIAICINSVVTKKRLKIGKFTCKKKKTLLGKNKLMKLTDNTILLKKKK